MSEVASGRREMVDVAIVGAGPMGLVTALMCLRAGLKVAIYERQADFSGSPAWNGTGVLAPDCEADGADATIVDLGRRSIELWPTLIPGLNVNGALVLGNRRQPAAPRRLFHLRPQLRLGRRGADRCSRAVARGRLQPGHVLPAGRHMPIRAFCFQVSRMCLRLEASGSASTGSARSTACRPSASSIRAASARATVFQNLGPSQRRWRRCAATRSSSPGRSVSCTIGTPSM